MNNNFWTAKKISFVLDGEWITPPDENWKATNVAVSKEHCVNPHTLFIAIRRSQFMGSEI